MQHLQFHLGQLNLKQDWFKHVSKIAQREKVLVEKVVENQLIIMFNFFEYMISLTTEKNKTKPILAALLDNQKVIEG